jgi:hypothetical protein
VSNVNYVSGDVRPNQVTVGVGAGGYIKVYSWAAADVIVDIMGYYAGGSAVPGGFVPIAPQRIMDTRINLGNMYYDPTTDSVVLAIAGTAGMPAAAAIRGFSLNVTADQTDRPGYVTVYPDGRSRPVSSNLNFETSQTVANAVSVGVGTEGGIEIYTPAFPEVIVDLEGYFKA